MNLKNLTENRYTLNDVFVKNYQIWCLLPSIMFTLVILFVPLLGFAREEVTEYIEVLGAAITIVTAVSFVKYSRERNLPYKDCRVTYILFGAVLVISVLANIVNKVPRGAWLGIRGEGDINGYQFFAGYLLVYFLIVSLIREEKFKKIIVGFFCLAALIIDVLTLVDTYITTINDYSIFTDRSGGYQLPTGPFVHFNYFGYFCVMSVLVAAAVFALSKKLCVKIPALLLLALNSYILNMTDCFGAFISVFVGFLFLFIAEAVRDKKFSWWLLLALGVYVTVNALGTIDMLGQLKTAVGWAEDIASNSEAAGDAGTGRWRIWLGTIECIKDKPILGWGIAGDAAKLDSLSGASATHNEYLTVAAYYGIPCAIVYVAAIVSVFIRAVKNKQHLDNTTLVCLTAAFGYCVSAFFGIQKPYVAPFFFTFLGLSVVRRPVGEAAEEV